LGTSDLIIDTSALVAIIKGEPEADQFTELMLNSSCKISAASYVELAIVIDGQGDPIVSRKFDLLCKALNLEITPVTQEQARIAREANRDFGKSSSHPAKLNLGDCFSYALAKELNEVLLFKGDDFDKTDVSYINM
jgi:ribonuclease VapC